MHDSPIPMQERLPEGLLAPAMTSLEASVITIGGTHSSLIPRRTICRRESSKPHSDAICADALAAAAFSQAMSRCFACGCLPSLLTSSPLHRTKLR